MQVSYDARFYRGGRGGGLAAASATSPPPRCASAQQHLQYTAITRYFPLDVERHRLYYFTEFNRIMAEMVGFSEPLFRRPWQSNFPPKGAYHKQQAAAALQTKAESGCSLQHNTFFREMFSSAVSPNKTFRNSDKVQVATEGLQLLTAHFKQGLNLRL